MNNKQSLNDLKNTIENISSDVSFLFDGLRSNWWESKQIVVLDKDPKDKPSLTLYCKNDPSFSVEDTKPLFSYNKTNGTVHLWNPSSLSWIELSSCNNKVLTVDSKKATIKFDPKIKTYFQDISSKKTLSFDTSLLKSEDVSYNIELILNVTGEKTSVTLPSDILWNKGEKPSLKPGKTYILYLKVINNIIFGTFEEYTK